MCNIYNIVPERGVSNNITINKNDTKIDGDDKFVQNNNIKIDNIAISHPLQLFIIDCDS